MRTIIIIAMFVFIAAVTVQAVDNTKPDTHNTSWVAKHGQAAKINEADCLTCHEERLECIACHEDMAPRNHSIAWVQKNHGLESRWNRMQCTTCHREDFCSACHEESVPISHTRSGFSNPSSAGFHCQTSCQLPSGSWKNTPSKNCIVCHKTRPITQSTGALHNMN